MVDASSPPPAAGSGEASPLPAAGPWLRFLRALAGLPSPDGRSLLQAAWDDLRRPTEAVLELWQDGRRRQRLPLGEGRVRIGRDPGCELPVDATGVSRIHAIVEKERSGDRDFTLEDFDSANGLFFRDRRLQLLGLRHGDEVQLGSPLKGGTPTLRYLHPRSPLERLIHGAGLGALVGSGVLVAGLLAASTVVGGSTIRTIGGPVQVVAADGQRIDPREGSATPLPSLSDYPLHLRRALVSSEDSRFGWNSGLDLFGTLRSLVRASGGGSGLTQQVARLYYPAVGTDFSLARKLRELWVAWQLETGFSKNQILKMYLDRAHLGLGVDGFEQAARLYFRKSARDLDLAESAFLVGLLPSPNGYSPCFAPPPSAGEETWLPVLRRNLVLRRMHEDGAIGQDALRDALRRPLNIDPSVCRASTWQSHPYFSDYVVGELQGRRFGLQLDETRSGGNYHVVSTIDPRLQGIAEAELRRFLRRQGEAAGLTQGALITVDVRSGEILAYVGGGDYARSSFDRVQALRQPGSTFKLFPFLKALESGIEPGEPISCAPLGYVAGCRRGGGSQSVADGFAHSENVVALRLADRVGLEAVIRRARDLGISTPLEASHSMVLGGSETFLYEMARAYAVVANGGRSVPLHGVRRIYDLGVCGSVEALDRCPARGITDPVGEEPRQLIDPAVAGQLDRLLRQVVSEGTGRPAAVVPDARGKTGTTDSAVDVAFIGYSPASGLLTAIWMGNDDNRPAPAASSHLPATLWGRYMARIAA